MATSDYWTCMPREHEFTDMPRVALPPDNPTQWEPARIYCRKCGWVRLVDDIRHAEPAPEPA